MEDIICQLILLACGAMLFCIGVFNGRWSIVIRNLLNSPLKPFLPQVVVRVMYACIGLAVMTLASLMLAGVETTTPPIVNVEIDGTHGVKVIATVTADGEEGRIDGPLPNAFHAQARNVSYRIENVGEAGNMTVNVFANGYFMGAVTADRDHPLVLGTVVNGLVSQRAEPKRRP